MVFNVIISATSIRWWLVDTLLISHSRPRQLSIAFVSWRQIEKQKTISCDEYLISNSCSWHFFVDCELQWSATCMSRYTHTYQIVAGEQGTGVAGGGVQQVQPACISKRNSRCRQFLQAGGQQVPHTGYLLRPTITHHVSLWLTSGWVSTSAPDCSRTNPSQPTGGL